AVRGEAGRAAPLSRARREAAGGRDPRYRVPRAVPAAPVRRARAMGASRRHDAGAFPAQGQVAALSRRVCPVDLGVSVPAEPRTPAPPRRGPADPYPAAAAPPAPDPPPHN